MDVITILRQLWRFRLLVAIVAVLAILAGISLAYKLPSMESRQYQVGVASARILIDTPDSQVVDLAPKGSDSVGTRATLLSNLMVDGEMKTAIAKRAGLRPEQLIALSTDAATPSAAAPIPGPESYVLSTKVTMISNGVWLPIIEVETQAPDATAARKLADSAVVGLTQFLESKATAEAVPAGNRLSVSGLGQASAGTETRGTKPLMGLIAAIFLFAAGCAAILAIAALVRGLRAPEEQLEAPRRVPRERFEPRQPDFDFDDAWAEDQQPARVVPLRPAEAAAPQPQPKPARVANQGTPPAPDSASSWWGGGPA